MNYDLISFDLDGTLVDTAGEIAEAANLTLEAHGLARRPVAEVTALIGAGTRELMRDLLARCAQEHPPSVQHLHIDAVMAIFDRHYTVITGSLGVPYAGCQEALSALRIAGLRLACTTNKELRHARHVLEVTQLASFFDLVVGGDTLPQKKPHGSVLGYVMRTLGARASTGINSSFSL